MALRLIALFILLPGLCAPAQALERRYQASMDVSQWTLSQNSAIGCRIEHQIPRFGRAVFTQEAGRGLKLELDTSHRFAKGINVELRSEANAWNASGTRAVLARFETSGRKGLFKIPSTIAEQAYFELRKGYQPGFLFYDDQPMIASLSSVRFGEVETEFNQCVARLYRHNFNDVRVSSIHFEPDNEFASIREEESAFVNMLDYLKVDSAISEIVVTGHTDNTGLACYNDGLSERRAWYVYDLLIARGIDSKLLRVDYVGEQNPARNGSNKKSLAANRRVTVELRR
ncbi:MAG: OmpA family protein [Gammaproteobacteria bacterium]|nr:OmpA family protein [Gammaproteobacteria bacterium]MDH3857133.1 OmpA family protein [Gammaproteobacteria bacterium]